MSGKEKGFVIIVLAICVFACCYIFYKPQPCFSDFDASLRARSADVPASCKVLFNQSN
jgi:hypothetical protein